MNTGKIYWKGLEQLNNTREFAARANKEFPEHLPDEQSEREGTSRRDFLKLMGFGIGAVSLAACEAPVRKSIPWVKKPETIDPGIPNYYATTYASGSDYCNIVVKTTEGRPIKVEGNELSGYSGGGTTPQVEASVLSLYDKQRLTAPMQGQKTISWQDIDQAVAGLPSSSRVAFVSNTIASPSTLKALELFQSKFNNAEHIVYDQQSRHGELEANAKAFGQRLLPTYDLSRAETIVSFGADILGSDGVNETLNKKQFAVSRRLDADKKTMSRLYAFESNFSLTGANADYRFPVRSSALPKLALALYEAIVEGKSPQDDHLKMVVRDLKKSRSSLVISGSNDESTQLLIIAINNVLGNYGKTLFTANPTMVRRGSDARFSSFVAGADAGRFDAVFFLNCNPVYDHPLGPALGKALSKVKFSLSTSDRKDETSLLVKYNAPDTHYLESWNDFQLTSSAYSLSQPTISRIFDARQMQDSFLKWAGSSESYYDFIRKNWEENMLPQSPVSDFNAFWDKCLHDGVFTGEVSSEELSFGELDLNDAKSKVRGLKTGEGFELIIYENAAVGNGIQANNPWLQEMSDPMTKACWDNYLTVAPKQAEEWGVRFEDMTTQRVNLKVGNRELNVPVLAQPGQAYNTLGLALGYGRTAAGIVADGVGVNAYPLISTGGGQLDYTISEGVNVTPTGEPYQVAQTQTSQTYMGRETVIQETVLDAYQKDPQAGRYFPKIATSEGFKKPSAVSLWKGHEYANHHWGMAVDLNSCTGCGSCTIACQAENNVPVVGKQEVLNRREMHWIRIDRYYSTDAKEGDVVEMEHAAQTPEVTFQPMMCQQCNSAPCETVCPVAATSHSSEGLNQMSYNRCIGTRYCANNCPYKVRRFNWFKYHDNDQFETNLSMSNYLGKMVLNPDVTVRARGVMEKCTFCVQRIQAGKLEAKKEKRRPVDGEIQTACVKSCPSDALVFGDMKDPESKISKLLQIKSMKKGVEAQEPRAYHVLEELRVMPNVWYLTKVRNKEEVKETAKAENSPA